MSYKHNAASDRDALFGGAGGTPGGGGRGRGRGGSSSSSSSRPASYTSRSRPVGSSTANRAASASRLATSATSSSTSPSTKGNLFNKRENKSSIPSLSGKAKELRMKEAEEYRQKAKKAMSKGLFQKPDPLRAGTYYRRAAELYRQCGENRLERLHRIASGDCQMSQDAYATAAAEYSRAAELAIQATELETAARRQKEVHQLYRCAAEAWMAAGDKPKLAEALSKSAFGLLIEVEEGKRFDSQTVTSMEEAIECHVPDVLNRFAVFRKTSKSDLSFFQPTTNTANEHPHHHHDDDDDDDPNHPSSGLTEEQAKEEISKSAYAHENVQQILDACVNAGEYETALYAAGAVTTLLESSGYATISLSRAYLTETILQLALGDIVAADQTYMQVHLQNTSYLRARECALAEDLIRAVKNYDIEGLEKAQEDRTLANVTPGLRSLVQTLRVAGMAKKKKKAPVGVGQGIMAAPPPVPDAAAAAAAMQPNYPPRQGGAELPKKKKEENRELDGEELAKQLEQNYNELDAIMQDMGLDSDEEGHDDGDDDDDIDLR